MSAHDARGHIMRVALGMLLPALVALPAWWMLRAERAALGQTRATLETELTGLVEAERLGRENQRLRAAAIERLVVIEALDRHRMRPLDWLGALGRLPPDVMLTRAALDGGDWVIAGRAPSVERLDQARAGLDQNGLQPEAAGQISPDGTGVEFELRGSLGDHQADTVP